MTELVLMINEWNIASLFMEKLVKLVADSPVLGQDGFLNRWLKLLFIPNFFSLSSNFVIDRVNASTVQYCLSICFDKQAARLELMDSPRYFCRSDRKKNTLLSTLWLKKGMLLVWAPLLSVEHNMIWHFRMISSFWRRTRDMTKQKSRSGTSENSHNHHRCCEYRYKCFTILISAAFSRGFKADCPDGSLGKEKILEMYSMILPAGNAKVIM